jgi:hypothetical protein
MDSENEQLPAHADRFSRDPDAMLADLRSGLDALRSLLSGSTRGKPGWGWTPVAPLSRSCTSWSSSTT